MFAMTYNKKLYDFCERHYAEWQSVDGGYYPSKHDKIVFEAAAKEFGVSASEAYETYHTERQFAVDKYLKRINKLPAPLRTRVLHEVASNILKANKDNPFSRLEGEADQRFLP